MRGEVKEKNPMAFLVKYKKIKKSSEVIHTRGCKCKTTKCLKKYCECFKKGIGCSPLCSCLDCQNKKIKIQKKEAVAYQNKIKKPKLR